MILYGQQVINVGTTANDKTGDPLRTAFQKVNTNFSSVYDSLEKKAPITGTVPGLTVGNVQWIVRGAGNFLSVYSLGDPGNFQTFYGGGGGFYIYPGTGTYLRNYLDTTYLETGTVKFIGGNLGYNTGRLGKGWLTDLDITNLPTINGGTLKAGLGVTTLGNSFLTITDVTEVRFPRINANNSVSALTAADMKTALGVTYVGNSFFTLTNPSAITFPMINANNTVTALSAANFKTAIAIGQSDVSALADSLLNKPTKAQMSDAIKDSINAITHLIPYIGAAFDMNFGDKNILMTGNIGNESTKINHAYFSDITVSNPLRARIRSDSILWAEADTTRGIRKADSTGFREGNYMTRQNYVDDPTNETFIKNTKELGSVYKYYPIRCDYTFNLHVALAGTRAYFTRYYISKRDTITGVKYSLYATGDYNQKDFNGVALYSESGGNLTQVAISNNDSTFLCITQNTLGTIDFTAPVVVDPGSYYVILLYNYDSYVAHPDVYACAANLHTALINNQFPNSNRLSAYKDAITTLVGYEPAMSITAALSSVVGLILY